MNDQFSLLGFDEIVPGNNELYFALYPDAAAKVQITQLSNDVRRDHQLSGKAYSPDLLHLSLYGLGSYADVPSSIVALASKAAARIAIQPFEVMLNSVVSFHGNAARRPLVLCGDKNVNAGLMALHQTLAVEMKRQGLGHFVASSFTPHVTMLYDPKPINAIAIQPISWTVRELVLVFSLHGKAKHEIKGCWPISTQLLGHDK
jgi:RNA 2',3'-cyclic 3'-phosphodiesterase